MSISPLEHLGFRFLRSLFGFIQFLSWVLSVPISHPSGHFYPKLSISVVVPSRLDVLA